MIIFLSFYLQQGLDTFPYSRTVRQIDMQTVIELVTHSGETELDTITQRSSITECVCEKLILTCLQVCKGCKQIARAV